MPFKILSLFLLFLCSSPCLQGQSEYQFTSHELAAFVEIYFDQKEYKTENKMRNFNKYAVENDPESILFKEYFTKTLIGESLDPWPLGYHKLLAISEVKDFEKDIKREQDNRLQLRCDEFKISTDKYASILHKYQKDLAFQKLVKPYFLAYFSKIHK